MGVGQRAADVVETDAPRHLLDEVDLPVEIGAERRRRRVQHSPALTVGTGRRVELDAERRERVPHVFGVEEGAEHRVDATRAHLDARSFERCRILVTLLGRDVRTGHFDQQLHRARPR